jgi:hypothetical protein
MPYLVMAPWLSPDAHSAAGLGDDNGLQTTENSGSGKSEGFRTLAGMNALFLPFG